MFNCEFCTKVTTSSDKINEFHLDMLQIIIPNFVMEKYVDIIICKGCDIQITNLFKFKSTCLEFEDTIYNYKKDKQINLENILGLTDNNGRVCRTCFDIIEQDLFVEIKKSVMKQHRDTCLSEMDFSLTKAPVLCLTCVESLEKYFKFLKYIENKEKSVKEQQFEIKSTKTVPEEIKDIVCIDIEDETDQLEEPPICRIVSSESVAENSAHQSISEADETNIEQLEHESSNEDSQNKSEFNKISLSENLKDKTKNVDILPIQKIENDDILIEEHNVEKKYEAILREYSSNEDSVTMESIQPDLNNSINEDVKTNLKLSASTETGGQNVNSSIDDENSKNKEGLEDEATKSKAGVETNQITGEVGESSMVEPEETSDDLDDDNNFDNNIEGISSNDEIVPSDTENVAKTSQTSENNEKDSAECHPKQSGDSPGIQIGNQTLGQLIILSPIQNKNSRATSNSKDEIEHRLEDNGVTEQKSDRSKRGRRRRKRLKSNGSAPSDDNNDPDFIPDDNDPDFIPDDNSDTDFIVENEKEFSNEKKNLKRKTVKKYFYCKFCAHRDLISTRLDDHMSDCWRRPPGPRPLTIVEKSLFSEITHLRQQVERLENMHAAKKQKPDTPPNSNLLLYSLLTDSDTDTSVDSETDSLLKAISISDTSIKLPKNRILQKFTNVDQNAIIRSLMKIPKVQDSTQTLLKKLLKSKQSSRKKKSRKSTKKDGNSLVTINIDTPGFVRPDNQLSTPLSLSALATPSPYPPLAPFSHNPEYKTGPSSGANDPQGPLYNPLGVPGLLLFQDKSYPQYTPATAYPNLAPNADRYIRFPLVSPSKPANFTVQKPTNSTVQKPANSTVQNSAPKAASVTPNKPANTPFPNSVLNNLRCLRLSSVPPQTTDRSLTWNQRSSAEILSNLLRQSPGVPENTPKRKTLPRTCKSIVVELSSDEEEEEEKEKNLGSVSEVEEVIIPPETVFTDEVPYSKFDNSAQSTADPLDPLALDDDASRPVNTFVTKQKDSPKTKINISSIVIVNPNNSRNIETPFTEPTKVQDKTTVEEKDSDINSIINELEDIIDSLDRNKMLDKDLEEVIVSPDPTKISDKAEKGQENLEEIVASADPAKISDRAENDQVLNLEAGANAHEDESDGDDGLPDTGTDLINSDLDLDKDEDVTQDVEMSQTTDESKKADINDANAIISLSNVTKPNTSDTTENAFVTKATERSDDGKDETTTNTTDEVSKSIDPVPETIDTLAGTLIVEKVNEYLETINSDEEAPSRTEETPSGAEETPSGAEEAPSRAEETPSRAKETPSTAEGTVSRAEKNSALEVTIVSDDETPASPSSTKTVKVTSNTSLKDIITKALKHPQTQRRDPEQGKPKSDYVLNNHRLDPRQLAIFKCNWCPFNTRYFELIDIHVLSHYDYFKKEQNYSCKDCAVSFFQKILLQKHMQSHHGNFGYKLCFWCVNCAISFANTEEFKTHDKKCERKNISVKLFKSNHVVYCMLCSYETTFMDKARKHSQTCVSRQTKITEVVEID